MSEPIVTGRLSWARAVELATEAGRIYQVKQRVYKNWLWGWTWTDAS